MSSRVNNFFEFGDFRLEAENRTLWRDNAVVPLSPKSLELLQLLIERRGQIVTKQEIFDSVWAGTFVEDGVLTQNIYTLRSKLGLDEEGRQFIETVPRRGYRFAGHLKETSRPDVGAALDTFDDGALSAEVREENDSDSLERLEKNTVRTLKAAQPASAKSLFSARAVFLLVLGLLIFAAAGFGVFHLVFPDGDNSDKRDVKTNAPIEQVRFQRLTSSGDVIHPTISPDGETLAYVRVENNGESVWLKQIATGSSLPALPLSGNGYRSLSYSPDGNFLFFRELSDPGSIFQTPLYGGTQKKVADNAWSDFSLSPDGKQLAFVRRDSARDASLLILSNLNDGKERELSSRPFGGGYRGSAPAWSPDGGRIIIPVSSMQEPRPVLFEVDVATGEQTELPTPKWREINRCLWMPNSKQVVVAARSYDEPVSQLWMMDVPEGTVQRLTNDLEAYFWMSLSADGKKLVTRQQRITAHLWLFENGDPQKARQLTFGERNQDGQTGFAYLPDKRILFSAFDGKATDIYSIDANGGNRMQLTSVPGRDSNWPSVSAGGDRIAFVSARTGTRQVWLMNADGTNQTQLTFGEKLTDAGFAPAMSPDGRVVFFIRTGSRPSSIWKVSAEGGRPVQVSSFKDASAEVFLTISPDGKWLAYQHVSTLFENAGEERAIVVGVIPSDGSAEPKLFSLPLRRPLVKWATDSKSFYFSAGTFNASAFLRQPLDGGKAEKIFDLPHRLVNFEWSKDGRDLVISRGKLIGDAILITDLPDIY